MNRTKFCGELLNTTHQVILTILKENGIIDENNVNLKIRLYGEEITYADDKIYIYIPKHLRRQKKQGKIITYLTESFLEPLQM